LYLLYVSLILNTIIILFIVMLLNYHVFITLNAYIVIKIAMNTSQRQCMLLRNRRFRNHFVNFWICFVCLRWNLASNELHSLDIYVSLHIWFPWRGAIHLLSLLLLVILNFIFTATSCLAAEFKYSTHNLLIFDDFQHRIIHIHHSFIRTRTHFKLLVPS